MRASIMGMTNKHAILLLAVLLFYRVAAAEAKLRPNEILVVANKYVEQSANLARYYMEQRKIPPENLLLLLPTQ